MRNDKSMLDEAFDILSEEKKEISFTDLVAKIATNLEMSDDEKISHLGTFYTDLSLDGRFVALTDNTWDLRSRHTYAKVHIDVNDVYSEVDEADEDVEDQEEEKEYNAQVEGKAIAPDAVPTDEEEEGEKKLSEEDIESLGIKKGEDY